jgi:hypothetical protein
VRQAISTFHHSKITNQAHVDQHLQSGREPLELRDRETFSAAALAQTCGNQTIGKHVSTNTVVGQAIRELVQQAHITHTQAAERVYLGRKPSYSRDQLARVLDLLAADSDIAIAKQVGLHRLAVRRVRQDPAKAEAALASWEALKARPRRSKAADRDLPEAIHARANLVQRIKEGVARARAAGKRLGRPTLPPEKEAAVRKLLRKGVSTRATAVKASVGVGTVIRIKRALGLDIGARPGRNDLDKR